jgi:hypothetical protein
MTPPHFYIFCDYHPFEEHLALYLNSLYPRMIRTKLDSIWPAGSGEVDFLKLSVHFHSFASISPWRGAIPFL